MVGPKPITFGEFLHFVGLWFLMASIIGPQQSDFWASHPDRIPSTTPGAEPPRDARDSGSARSHSTHLETSSSDRH